MNRDPYQRPTRHELTPAGDSAIPEPIAFQCLELYRANKSVAEIATQLGVDENDVTTSVLWAQRRAALVKGPTVNTETIDTQEAAGLCADGWQTDATGKAAARADWHIVRDEPEGAC